MRVPDENGLDKVKAMKDNYAKLKLDCLVILGGNGTQKTANLLREEGLNIVSLPKTIDNDLWGTDITFGFRVLLMSLRMRLIVFIPRHLHMAGYSSWKLWVIRSDGSHCMPELPVVLI